MVIRFSCPNGHNIHCPDDRAGKAAKCPRCGIRFRIPTSEDSDEAPESGTNGSSLGSGVAMPLADSEGSSVGTEPTAPSPAERDEEIEFLCPNGHRLQGPASLQGRAGQCPDCNARFKIPSYDDVPDENEEDVGSELQLSLYEEDSAIRLEDESELHDAVATFGRLSEADDSEEDEEAEDGSDRQDARAPRSRNPAARVFQVLWDLHQADDEAGGVIEVYLSDGKKITPEFFASRLSAGSHAVFTVEETNGSFTVTAVAWENIARIIIRNLEEMDERLGS